MPSEYVFLLILLGLVVLLFADSVALALRPWRRRRRVRSYLESFHTLDEAEALAERDFGR